MYNISNKTFEGLTFRLHIRDKQILQNLKTLLENHYVDDLEIKEVDSNTWADMKLIDKNSNKQTDKLMDEIKDYKSEIATLIKERQKLKRKNDNLRLKIVKKDKIKEEIKDCNPIIKYKNIKQELKEHRIKQLLVAEVADCSVASVNRYLNKKTLGKRNKLRIKVAIEILLKEYKNMGS